MAKVGDPEGAICVSEPYLITTTLLPPNYWLLVVFIFIYLIFESKSLLKRSMIYHTFDNNF